MFRYELAAHDGHLEEGHGTLLWLAELLVEDVDIQAEVQRARQVVRVSLHATNNLFGIRGFSYVSKSTQRLVKEKKDPSRSVICR